MKTAFLAILFFLGQILAALSQTNQDPAFKPVIDDPKLPRVLLIGDSISIGYTVPVQKRLASEANVHRIPENGGPTTNGVAQLDKWLGNGKWDVIHFNFGLHDLKIMRGQTHQVPLPEYEKNLREIVRRLNTTGAKLIWATTTPVPPTLKKGRRTEDVPPYNEIAKKVMVENHVAIDDLYTLILPLAAKLQKPANVHFHPEGYEILGQSVADSIERALVPATAQPATRDFRARTH